MYQRARRIRYDDPLLGVTLSCVVVDEAEIRRTVAALLEP